MLNVRVGLFSSISLISPNGTRLSLIRAWKPLQIPSIIPSLFLSKSITASLTFGFLNTAAINLPEPSGSSPALKPPGIIIIWLLWIISTILSIDSSSHCVLRFVTTKVSATAPAFSKALFVSYSQLLPGNTGIRTLGAAMPLPENFFSTTLNGLISMSAFFTSSRYFVGNIFSRGLIHILSASSRSIVTPLATILFSEVVLPITAKL